MSLEPSSNSLFRQHAATHTNPWSVGASVIVNSIILALSLCLGLRHRTPLPLSSPSDT